MGGFKSEILNRSRVVARDMVQNDYDKLGAASASGYAHGCRATARAYALTNAGQVAGLAMTVSLRD